MDNNKKACQREKKGFSRGKRGCQTKTKDLQTIKLGLSGEKYIVRQKQELSDKKTRIVRKKEQGFSDKK